MKIISALYNRSEIYDSNILTLLPHFFELKLKTLNVQDMATSSFYYTININLRKQQLILWNEYLLILVINKKKISYRIQFGLLIRFIHAVQIKRHAFIQILAELQRSLSYKDMMLTWTNSHIKHEYEDETKKRLFSD